MRPLLPQALLLGACSLVWLAACGAEGGKRRAVAEELADWWHTDWGVASALAEEEAKPILAVFR